MKLNIQIVANATTQLGEILKQPMNASKAFDLFVWMKKISPELEAFENERVKLIKELGVKKENGDVQIEQDKTQEFIERLSEFSKDKEVEIPDIKLSKEDLGNAKLSFTDLQAISFLLEE